MSANPTAIGLFTADNIAAILGAIPDSNGTYADIADIATNRGADVSPRTLAKWIVRGRQELERKKTTALARFAKLYDDRLNQHCGPDVNRHRELDRALFLLQRTCECGQEKMLLPDGRIADRCRLCEELDRTPRKGKGTKDEHAAQPETSANGFHPAASRPD